MGKMPLILHGKLQLEEVSVGKMNIWEVVTWENEYLGSCHLGK